MENHVQVIQLNSSQLRIIYCIASRSQSQFVCCLIVISVICLCLGDRIWNQSWWLNTCFHFIPPELLILLPEPIDKRFTLVQTIASYRQATRHYQNQLWKNTLFLVLFYISARLLFSERFKLCLLAFTGCIMNYMMRANLSIAVVCMTTDFGPGSNSTTNSSQSTVTNGEVLHDNDVIMGAIASQITSITIVYSNVYSDADQRKHPSSASLAFVGSPVNSPHKWPVTRKTFPFDDVIMY